MNNTSNTADTLHLTPLVPQDDTLCNYDNNYYGDQLCLPEHRVSAPPAARSDYQCNYDNNYYQDRVCVRRKTQ